MNESWIGDALVFVVIGATIVAGSVLLRLFFDFRGYIKHRVLDKNGYLIKKLPGINARGTVQVHLKDGKTYVGLRLVGVMDADAARETGLPYALTNLTCFEREDGGRVWIDAGAIRVIEGMREDTD